MNYILFDDDSRSQLLPFTYTRPVSQIRIGIMTISEKWERFFNHKVSFLTQSYLQEKYPLHTESENLLVNGSVIPDSMLIIAIGNLKKDEQLICGNKVIAYYADKKDVLNGHSAPLNQLQRKAVNYEEALFCISNLWDIFLLNEKAIKQDFAMLTNGRKSAVLSASNKAINPQNIFLEPGAKVECAILNASAGPIYIAGDAEVMEGCTIRGPFALGEHATLKMGAKVYGATTIGPHSKVGGEVSNAVIFGYSNKAHDGFLGNAVLGEWCNLGADTNNSNLKNNYGTVKVWNEAKKDYIDSGLQFCGLFMGDHSKCGINTMFNTGTVVGVCSNIFGAGFPPKFIPSFSWGGGDDFVAFKLEKAIELATQVYKRREMVFDDREIAVLSYLNQQLKQ